MHIFKTKLPHTPTRRPKTKDADERNTTMAPRVVPYSHIITKEMMNVWDVKDFSLKLAKNVLLWEIPRAFASVAISRARRNEPQTAKEKTFVATAPAYVMSAVHAVVVAYIGAKIGWEALALKETRDQYYLNKKTAMTMESLRFTELGNWAFCGYMTGDLLHVLAEYPRLGKMDTVVHHACFIACSLLAGHSQTMILPFSWLLIGELSTPLLCLRWFVQQYTYELESEKIIAVAKALGFKGDAVGSVKNAGKQVEFMTSVAFMASFFLARIVCYSAGFAHMLWAWRAGILNPIPSSVTNTLIALVSCGAALNYYWFSIMVKKALRGPPKPKPSETETTKKEE